MNDERNRLGKGFAVAIVAHVIFALLLGVFGFSFNSNRPPEILEVSLVAGGGAPEEPQEEVVEEAEPVIEEEDQIVETKEKPKVEPKKPVADKKPDKNPNPNPSPKKGDHKTVGKGDGIGDGQGVPVTPPRPIRTVEPKYPASARNASVEGLVKIKMLITYEGKVTEASIVQSSGHAEMDANALEAVYKWRFSPARNKLKQKIDCYITMPIKFKLRR
ncbi:MAG: TonB family protein [Phascolarctobacterium sp.]|nr:TonB family protein [Phascolarctobacterium sp.]MBQ7759615.1 TonB family protein [Acidaminococcaceae bacterium]MBQ7883501.1 TonB family protein [Phascolarctobacterium sp.]